MPRHPSHRPPTRPTGRPHPPGRAAGRRPTGALVLAAGATGALTWTLGRRAVALVGGDGNPLGGVDGVAAVRAAWSAPGVRVEDLLELLAVLAGTGVAAWFALGLAVAAGCASARSAGRAWLAGERWVSRAAPGVVRRALLASAGTGLALAGALPAAALAPPPPDDLGWAVTADRTPDAVPAPAGPTPPGNPPSPPAAPAAATVPTSSPAPAPAPPSAGAPVGAAAPVSGPGGAPAPGGPAPQAVTVEPGDTLWDIALEHLPVGATAADVAAAWPGWYAANLAVVGPDPDLIRPGQHLVAPAAAATTTDGAGR